MTKLSVSMTLQLWEVVKLRDNYLDDKYTTKIGYILHVDGSDDQ